MPHGPVASGSLCMTLARHLLAVVAPVGLEPTISGVKTRRALPQLQEAPCVLRVSSISYHPGMRNDLALMSDYVNG